MDSKPMNENSLTVDRPLTGPAAFLARCAALALVTLHAHAVEVIPEVGYVLHRLGPVGAQGWGEVDADGDGRVDLVTSADGPAALILVYGRIAGSSQLRLKQSLVRPPDSIAALATIPGGGATVVAVGADRIATLYGGWPLSEQGSFAIDHAATRVRVGDVDDDGTLELVCMGADALSAYALPGGELKWSLTLAATDFALAPLDGDPALELVIARGDDAPGMVLDGATLLQEWLWQDGFGSYVAAGRFGDFLEPGFVGAKDFGPVSGFRVAPYAWDWGIDNFDTDGVAAGDTDADGRDEFAVGDGQWGSVRIHDGPTRQLLYQFGNQGHGMWALDFLDLDGDSRAEVWYSARIENSSDRDDNFAAAIMNPITALPRLVIDSYWQGASASTLADLDGDGRLQWIIGTSGPFSYHGLLRVVDATSLEEEWRAPYMGNANFEMGYRSLQVAQLDGNPVPKLIAVGGNRSYGFRFLVLNGANHQMEARVPPNHFIQIHDEMVASRVVQHVPGGNPELLVLSHANGIGYPSVQFDVYSLPAGEVLWSSPLLGGDYDRSLGLDVGQLDADPAPEYLAVHTAGLSAFDSASGAAEWSMPLTVDGALIVATDNGPTIYAHIAAGTVTVYDAETRQPINEFTLPAPLEQLARLPGNSAQLLAVAGERLLVIRASDGAVLAESGWIGGEPSPGDNLHVVREGAEWRVSTGRSFATYLHRIPDLDILFESGFE
jgi:hypothetical protein